MTADKLIHVCCFMSALLERLYGLDGIIELLAGGSSLLSCLS
jgi:hypothetical protein